MAAKYSKRVLALARVVAVLGVLGLSYQNCGDPQYGSSGSSSISGVATQALCSGEMLEAFKASYYPFLKDTCKSCHVPGGVGKGTFAHLADPEAAFSAFKNATTTKINANAQSSSHASPFTGEQNGARIQAASKLWEDARELCNSSVGSSFASVAETSAKTINPTAQYKTFTWDLDGEMDKGPSDVGNASFSIQIKTVTPNGAPPVYYLTNPTVSTGNAKILIGQIRLVIGGRLVETNSTYARLEVEVDQGRTGVVLSSATAILDAQVQPNDTIKILFGKLQKQP